MNISRPEANPETCPVPGVLMDEAGLQQKEQAFKELADFLPQLMWMANADGWIDWYNRQWFDYTGATPEEMAGWGWQSVHHPDALPKVLERWRAAIDKGVPFEMVFPLRGADGVFRPFLTRVNPARNAAGEVIRWFGTNTEITEQYAAEQAARESDRRYRRG